MPKSQIISASITDGTIANTDIADNLGRRNLIINGAMQIFQRATSATAVGSGYTTVDRFRGDTSTDGAFTTEKSTDNPFGTGNSLKCQVTTADTSLTGTQFSRIIQRIEAQNLQQLSYGTSSAKTLALSFWVKSNKTGIYSILLRKPDNTAYHFIHEYTISSANTWEQKKIIITPTAGSTSFITASAGKIDNDNGLGLELSFGLGQGSTYAIGTSNTWSSNTNTYASSNQVNWMDSTSNNFYLTQVQLEVNPQSTPFEHRSFGEELSLCQRYFFQKIKGNDEPVGVGVYKNSSQIRVNVEFPTEMRSDPTVTTTNSTNHFQAEATATDAFDGNWQVVQTSTTSGMVYSNTNVSSTQGEAAAVRSNSADARLAFNSEL